MKLHSSLGATVALTALFLAACSNDNDSTGGASPQPTVAGALAGARTTTLAYEPIYEWINGMGVEEFWARAKAERRAGHALNASVLYSAAASTLDRGDFLVLSIAPDFIADQNSFAGPAEFQGDPPYPVDLDGQTYNIVTMQTHGAREAQLVIDAIPLSR